MGNAPHYDTVTISERKERAHTHLGLESAVDRL